jgi:prevent-host-death family protein
MQRINVREARQHIGRLLDAVSAGEEVIITRRGKPVAKLLQFQEQGQEAAFFPRRKEFRESIPQALRSSTEEIRTIRDERD